METDSRGKLQYITKGQPARIMKQTSQNNFPVNIKKNPTDKLQGCLENNYYNGDGAGTTIK